MTATCIRLGKTLRKGEPIVHFRVEQQSFYENLEKSRELTVSLR